MFCSVAMSTYNGKRFLAEQLSSICAQTRPVDEIVVSDDGSSDGTLRILDDFRLAHPQIRWKILPSAENHGFRASFLRAIQACSGEILFLCDQDDRWAPGKVETMLRYFEANPAMLSLISDFKTIDANGNLLNPSAPTENLWVSDRVLRAPSAPVQISLSEMLGRNQGQGCAMAVLPPIPNNSADKTSAILFLMSIVSFLLRKIVYALFNLYASAYTHLRIIRYYLSRVMNVMMVKDAVAQRFRELCIQRGIRINELANLSGVTPSTVYSMLDPKRREISITTIKKLCDGLDISLSDFFTAPIFDQLEQEIK